MSGRKATHFRSSLPAVGGRKKKGAAGRRELEDPVTQVSALQGLEERATHESYHLSPQKGRYISHLSQSPSPPLGKIKKLTLKEVIKLASEASDAAEADTTVDVTQSISSEEHQGQEEDPEKASDETKETGKEKVTSKMNPISTFLQELDREIHRCGPLPKCPRQTSRRACRFELPIDITSLEDLKAVEYMLDYCVVSPSKQQSYQKIFQKHCKMHIEDSLKTDHLRSALEDHFCQTFGRGEVTILLEYLDWEPGTYIPEKTFVVMAAIFERILCHLDRTVSEDKEGKDELEVADFSGLDEKLEGLTLNVPLKKLLAFIQMS